MTTPPSPPPPGSGDPGGADTAGQAQPPPGGQQEPGGGQHPGPDDGPRVSRDQVRDLSTLRRSTDNRKLAGVAGGLARHLDIDPLLVRVALAVLVFFGGAGLLLYAAGWLLLPTDDESRATVDLDPRSRAVALLAVGVLALLLVLGDAWGGRGIAWPLGLLVLVAAVVWLASGGRGLPSRDDGHGAAAPAPPPPPGTAPPGAPAAGPVGPTGPGPAGASPPAQREDPRRRGPVWFWPTLALIALALGVLGTADLAGAPVVASAYAALALGVVAAVLLVAAFAGRGGGLILLGLLLLPVLGASMLAERVDGEHLTPRPTSAAQVPEHYDLATGELVLDLRDVADPAALDGREIDIDGQVGRIEVILPEDVDVEVDARVRGPGNVAALGDQRGGVGSRVRTDTGPDTPAPDLTLRATLGVGEILVRQP